MQRHSVASYLLSYATGDKAGFSLVELVVILAVVIFIGIVGTGYATRVRESQDLVGYKIYIRQFSTALEELKAQRPGRSWIDLNLGTFNFTWKDLHQYGMLTGEKWRRRGQHHAGLRNPDVFTLGYQHISTRTPPLAVSGVECGFGELLVQWGFREENISTAQLESLMAYGEEMGAVRSAHAQPRDRAGEASFLKTLGFCYPPP